MKKVVLFASVLLLAASCHTAPLPASTTGYDYSHKVLVGNQTLLVEIADTDKKMEQGLSGRESLSDGQGMMFDFRKNSSVAPDFWMKDMKFGLDLIWIKSGTIIGITEQVPAPLAGTANENLPIYSSPSPADEVLEVNSGWSKVHHIKTGDSVTW